jgi:hypothetical protein
MANWRKEGRLHQFRAKRIELHLEVYCDRFQSYFKSMRNHAKKHHWNKLVATYHEFYGWPVTPASCIGMRNALEATMLDEFGLKGLTPAELFPVAAQQGPLLYGTRVPSQSLHDRMCLDLKRLTGNHSGTGSRFLLSPSQSACIADGSGHLNDCGKRQASLASVASSKKGKTHPGTDLSGL